VREPLLYWLALLALLYGLITLMLLPVATGQREGPPRPPALHDGAERPPEQRARPRFRDRREGHPGRAKGGAADLGGQPGPVAADPEAENP